MRLRFVAAFIVCAAASLVPFLVTTHLPMSDLPEHMAQIAIWKAIDDPCYGYDALFTVHWGTPYLLAYVVMRTLAAVMTVQLAAKVTVFLTILLLPLSLRFLLRRTGGDLWLSLIGFPLAFGFSFYSGFLSFAFAIPLGITFLAVLFDVAASGSRRRLVLLSMLGILLAAAHALVFLHMATVATGIAVQLRPKQRAVGILAALMAPVIAVTAWAMAIRRVHPMAAHAIQWDWSWQRVLQLPALLFSNEREMPAMLLTIALTLIVVLAAPAVSRDRIRWTPLAVAAAVYLLGPLSAFGTAFLFPRWALFVAIGALLVLQRPRRSEALFRTLLLLAVIAWMAVLSHRFHRFAGEAQEFDVLVDALPTNQRVIMLRGAARASFSDEVPGPVFHHFSSYYVIRKGGLDAWSFASPSLFYAPMVQYRPGAEPVVQSTGVSRAAYWAGVAQFDHILLRGAPSDAERFFARAGIPVRLRGRSGSWWWFQTRHAGGGAGACPPLEP